MSKKLWQLGANESLVTDGDVSADFTSSNGVKVGKVGGTEIYAPKATASQFGLVKPVSATSAMTQSVGVNSDGALVTEPGGGGGGGLTGHTLTFNVSSADVNILDDYCCGEVVMLKGDGSNETISFNENFSSVLQGKSFSNVLAFYIVSTNRNSDYYNYQYIVEMGGYKYCMYRPYLLIAPAGSSAPPFVLVENATVTCIDNYTCLVGSTLVTMSDGSQRRIDTLHAGDKVLAYDADTNELVADELVFSDADEIKTFNRTDVWTFEGGFSVSTVRDHELYNVEKGGMKYMKDWTIGERAVTIDGREVALLKHDAIEGEVRHFKITGHHHNFFVNGLLNGDRHSRVCLKKGN